MVPLRYVVGIERGAGENKFEISLISSGAFLIHVSVETN